GQAIAAVTAEARGAAVRERNAVFHHVVVVRVAVPDEARAHGARGAKSLKDFPLVAPMEDFLLGKANSRAIKTSRFIFLERDVGEYACRYDLSAIGQKLRRFFREKFRIPLRL